MTEIERIYGWPILKVRLERMERRMSLLKQRKELAGTPERSENSQPSLVTLPVSCGSTSGGATPGSPSKNENKHFLKSAYKRPHGGNNQSESVTARGDSSLVACLLEPSPDHPWNTPLILPKTEVVTTCTTAATNSSASVSPSKQSSSRTPQKARSKGISSICEGMRTKLLYPLPLSHVKPEPELTRVESSHIEVPNWRYHAVTSCYQLEGTENLDDEIFFRRHHKLEIDEKRRKRWDMQRIREQRHNEKLRRGRSRKISRCGGKDQGDLNTFFPEFRDVQYVEVSETVPVVAFGCTVPQIPASEFSLDWFSGPKVSTLREDQGGGRKRTSSATASTTNRKDT